MSSEANYEFHENPGVGMEGDQPAISPEILTSETTHLIGLSETIEARNQAVKETYGPDARVLRILDSHTVSVDSVKSELRPGKTGLQFAIFNAFLREPYGVVAAKDLDVLGTRWSKVVAELNNRFDKSNPVISIEHVKGRGMLSLAPDIMIIDGRDPAPLSDEAALIKSVAEPKAQAIQPSRQAAAAPQDAPERVLVLDNLDELNRLTLAKLKSQAGSIKPSMLTIVSDSHVVINGDRYEEGRLPNVVLNELLANYLSKWVRVEELADNNPDVARKVRNFVQSLAMRKLVEYEYDETGGKTKLPLTLIRDLRTRANSR